jgi:hypothetical protein
MAALFILAAFASVLSVRKDKETADEEQ